MARFQGESPSGLTPAELQLLRERLERLREDLFAQLRRNQAVTRSSEPVVEPMDAAEQTREQDDAILFGERERALLREIDNALAKFDDGSYGLSEVSGQPIGFRRLEAIPWTRVASDDLPGMPSRA
jgi:DnaK suppressor protein